MATDLRTTITGFDSTTNVTSSGTNPSLQTAAGLYYEPTGALATQWSNQAQENIYENSLPSTDLSDVTMYGVFKDNFVDTYANQGLQLVIGDGTDLVGYDAGGSDAQGIRLPDYFFSIKLDVSIIVAAPGTAFTVISGSEANLSQSAATQVGFGGIHLSKANGNSANCYWDALYYHANDSYALRINAGTSGTPETTSDIVTDDITNGWGLISNPIGSVYQFFGPTEWGEPTANADVYFSASDETWIWIGDNGGGRAVTSDHFIFRIVGNATDTISVTWATIGITMSGVRGTFTVGDTNVNTIDWDNVTLIDFGAVSFAAASGTRTHDVVNFNNCDQVSPNGCNGSDWVFNGGFNANGAMLLDTAGDSNNIVGATFNSDGSGHAIEVTATGSYDFDNFTFDAGYAAVDRNAAVFNNSGGAITINVQNGGDSPSVWPDSSGAAMTQNLFNWAVGAASGTSLNLSMGGSPADGDTWIIITRNTGDQDPDDVTVTVGGTRTFTKLGRTYDATTGYTLCLWVYYDCSSAMGTAVANWSPAVTNRGMVGWLLSDGDVTEFEFNAQTNPGTGTDAVTTGGALTQTSNNEYLLGVVAENENSTMTAGTGYTNAGAGDVWSGGGHAIEDTLAGTSGDVGVTWTSSSSTTDTVACGVIVQARTTTINNAVTVRLEGVAEGTAISVIAQETVGTITAGDIILEGLANASGVLETTTFNYESAFNPSGLDVRITARNQGLPNAAVADDGGAQTDETTAANSGTTNDMTLTPTTPATGDAYYWGHSEQPTGLKINISDATTDTGQTITWEYWNGAWVSLSGVIDDTNSFQNSGLNYVSWTQPGDWATTTVNGQGPYYYLRARVSAVGGTPEQARGRWSSLDVTRYLPIPPTGVLQRTITGSGLTATLSQAVDSISTF